MRILFIDRSTCLTTVKDLQSQGRGGMVTSLFRVSDYLSLKGHDVTVYSDIEHTGVTEYGTKWLHEFWGEYDCLILNRGIGNGYPQVQAKSRILWTHDLPHSGFIPEPKNIKAFSAVVFMSRYAEYVWRTFYRDIGKSVQIPNGVTRRLFKPRGDEGYLIYGSAPNRGLDKLPLILDAVRARTGRSVRLLAFSKLASLHPGEGEDVFDYASIEDSNVELHEPVDQRQFASLMSRSTGMVLPSGYPEICSNTVLQALSCGKPVFTTGGLGYIDEWIQHRRNGMLTSTGPWDYMVHTVEMVRNIVEVLEKPRLYKRLCRGARWTPVWTWDKVGKAWLRLIKRVSR